MSPSLDPLTEWMKHHHAEVVESAEEAASSDEEELLVTPKSARLRSLSCDPLVSWMKNYEQRVEWSDTEKWSTPSWKGKERAIDLSLLDFPLEQGELPGQIAGPSTRHGVRRSAQCRIGTHISLRSSSPHSHSHPDLEGVGCLSFFFDCPKRRFSKRDRAAKIESIQHILNSSHSLDASEMVFPHAGHCQNLAHPPPPPTSGLGHSQSVEEKEQKGRWRRSMEGLSREMRMSEGVGLKYLVVHPGSSKDPDRPGVLATIASNIDHLLSSHPAMTLVLESMACKTGSIVGCSFSELAQIRSLCSFPTRLKFCLDLAHIHAQTHDLATPEGREAFTEDVEITLGAENVVCVHVSDTHAMSGSGSHDHCAIGKGTIGTSAIRHMMRSPLLARVGWILETSRFYPSNVTSRRIEELEKRRTREEIEFLEMIAGMDDDEWEERQDELEAERERRLNVVSTMLRRALPNHIYHTRTSNRKRGRAIAATQAKVPTKPVKKRSQRINVYSQEMEEMLRIARKILISRGCNLF